MLKKRVKRIGCVSVANVLTSVMWKKILNVSCTATKHNAESFEENKQELRHAESICCTGGDSLATQTLMEKENLVKLSASFHI